MSRISAMSHTITAILALAAIASTVRAEPPQPPDEAARAMAILLDAVQHGDIDKFESVCDATMKAAMTPGLLKPVHDRMAGLMDAGFKTEYMGALRRGEHITYYWKLAFTTGGTDDTLVELSLRNGKASGFFLR